MIELKGNLCNNLLKNSIILLIKIMSISDTIA